MLINNEILVTGNNRYIGTVLKEIFYNKNFNTSTLSNNLKDLN